MRSKSISLASQYNTETSNAGGTMSNQVGTSFKLHRIPHLHRLHQVDEDSEEDEVYDAVCFQCHLIGRLTDFSRTGNAR